MTEVNRGQGRILLAEDNAVNRKLAVWMLRRLGYEVDVAGTGQETIAAWERSAYDAILMDCHMPGMDGFEAAREIRRREGESRHTPIVAMTAGSQESDGASCAAAGMDDFVSKPVTIGDLSAVLERRRRANIRY